MSELLLLVCPVSAGMRTNFCGETIEANENSGMATADVDALRRSN
jgi:hypothetical protein